MLIIPVEELQQETILSLDKVIQSKLKSTVSFDDDEILSYTSKISKIRRNLPRGHSNSTVRRNVTRMVIYLRLKLIGKTWNTRNSLSSFTNTCCWRLFAWDWTLQKVKTKRIRKEGRREEKARTSKEKDVRTSKRKKKLRGRT